MKTIFIQLFVILLLSVSNQLGAQSIDQNVALEKQKKWFVATNSGIQMSGYKKVDFVKSNYSPLYNLTAGKWIAPGLALQVGYKGIYFNTISDNDKHYYSFFYSDIVLNLSVLFDNYDDRKMKFCPHIGAGFFYNFYYQKPNGCLNLGLLNAFPLSNTLEVLFDVSAIIGWDIYQGDEDILPGVTLGLSYSF